jgi:hypothetical protein
LNRDVHGNTETLDVQGDTTNKGEKGSVGEF